MNAVQRMVERSALFVREAYLPMDGPRPTEHPTGTSDNQLLRRASMTTKSATPTRGRGILDNGQASTSAQARELCWYSETSQPVQHGNDEQTVPAKVALCHNNDGLSAATQNVSAVD